MTQDYYKAETTKRYDIPLTHLDYTYIRACTDVKELEKILRVLRSGDEGCYPDLEKEAEKKLESLCPKSRVLRKDSPALRQSDLDKSEQEHLNSELENWRADMKSKEEVLTHAPVSEVAVAQDQVLQDNDTLPPVRSGKVISTDGKVKKPPPTKGDKKKKVMPRSYKEWDKFDVDKELEKTEEDSTRKKKAEPSSFKPDGIAAQIDTTGMSGEEKQARAIREKDKGNEAFHAHDYEESILYYTRSLSIAPLAATYNNRALAYLRLSNWDKAISDCNKVLSMEPQNIKALLRRGTALKGKKDYAKARADLDVVLGLESNNKTAQDLLKEITGLEKKAMKEAGEQKAKGRRMVIEEVDGSEEEEEEIEVEQPDHMVQSVVNGHCEDNSPASPDVPQAKAMSPDRPEEAKVPFTSDDTKQEIPQTTSASSTDSGSEEETSSEPNPPPSPEKAAVSAPASDTSGLKKPGEVWASGDANQAKVSSEQTTADTSSSQGTTDRSEDGAGDSSPEPREDEEAADDGDSSDSSEAEVEHARPVLIHKALPSDLATLKEQGNNLFRTGQYPEAINSYHKIITRLQKDADQVVNLSLMLSNRAACHFKIGDCSSAIRDCNSSLELVPHAVKPLLRRAAAYETMERYSHAYVDYKHVLRVDSSVDQAHQGASRCQHALTSHHGHHWRDRLPPQKHVSHWDVPVIMNENDVGEKPVTPQPPKVSAVKTSPGQAPPSASKGPQSTAEPQPPKEAPKPKVSTPPKEAPKPKVPTPAKEVPKSKVPTPEEKFEAIKSQGNKHVQKGEHEAAIKCYSQCVELFADRPAIFTNRALCYLKMNKAREAEDDCTTALALEPTNCKAFYRRALARKAQELYKDSLQDLLQLMRLEPANSAAKKEMDLVKALYKKEYDRLKAQPAADKKKAEPEKRRTRMKIEEVDDSDSGDTQPAPTPRAKGGNQKSSASTPSHSAKGSSKDPAPAQPTPVPDSKHHDSKLPGSNRPSEPSRKPGRGKSKKGAVKDTSLGLPVTPPSTPKLQGRITPYQFIQHWNSLKQAKDIQPYVQLLEQITPDELPAVISNKLDGHMLQIIARCANHDAQTGEVERAYNILRNIRQVPRFSTVAMFLSNKEKQDIRKVLESIQGTQSAEEVAAVRKDYGLK